MQDALKHSPGMAQCLTYEIHQLLLLHHRAPECMNTIANTSRGRSSNTSARIGLFYVTVHSRTLARLPGQERWSSGSLWSLVCAPHTQYGCGRARRSSQACLGVCQTGSAPHSSCLCGASSAGPLQLSD